MGQRLLVILFAALIAVPAGLRVRLPQHRARFGREVRHPADGAVCGGQGLAT